MADRHPGDAFKVAEFVAEIGSPLEPWQATALLDFYSLPKPPDAVPSEGTK
jgi:hypothetical protein